MGLVMAIIGANLFGFVGVILASPVVASIKLFLVYAMRKLFDMDPWEEIYQEETPNLPNPLMEKLGGFLRALYQKIIGLFKHK